MDMETPGKLLFGYGIQVFPLGFKQGSYHKQEFQAIRYFLIRDKFRVYAKGLLGKIYEFNPGILAMEKLNAYQAVIIP